MPRRPLPVVSVTALTLLLLALGCGGTMDDLKALGDKTKVEAAEWAVGKDQAACVDEALSRSQQQGQLEITYHSVNTVWLMGCLDSAAPTAGLCDGVPGSDEIMPSVNWRASFCASRGFGDGGDQRCHRLLKGVQDHCHPER